MNAVTLIFDEDVANILLEYGASPTAKDLTGQSVEALAKGLPMEKMLSEKIEEGKASPFEKQIIEFIIALILFVISYTGSQRIKDLANQVFAGLGEASASNDQK